MNRLFLARHAPSSTASSLTIGWDRGQMTDYLKKKKTDRQLYEGLSAPTVQIVSQSVRVKYWYSFFTPH